MYFFVIISDMASLPDYKLYKHRDKEIKFLVEYGVRHLKESDSLADPCLSKPK